MRSLRTMQNEVQKEEKYQPVVFHWDRWAKRTDQKARAEERNFNIITELTRLGTPTLAIMQDQQGVPMRQKVVQRV